MVVGTGHVVNVEKPFLVLPFITSAYHRMRIMHIYFQILKNKKRWKRLTTNTIKTPSVISLVW